MACKNQKTNQLNWLAIGYSGWPAAFRLLKFD